ncbi:tetratricopeptide repeat protein [Leptothoe sp. EHU-05/26/07-4]
MALPHRRSAPTSRRLVFLGLVLVLALTVFPYPAMAVTLVDGMNSIVAATSNSPPAVVNKVVQTEAVLEGGEQEQALRIDGTSLMQPINQALKQRFEQEYPGTDVTLRANGTDPALESLLKDDIDLAAIGRSLSAKEKAQGLIQIPVSQDAISIIIGRNNRFNGTLTLDQFAQIFRGKITNWAEIGGTPGPIRFIDRPLTSDTRLVLSKYGILTDSEQAQGAQVVRLETDDTAAVIRRLGNDGISYAIASQIQGQRQVKTVKIAVLLDTLPSDKYYPYSQVRGYVYRKDNANTVLPFINWVTGESGKAAVGAAKTAEATAVATALNPPALTRTATNKDGVGIPVWLWGLLPLPLLFLFGFSRRRQTKEMAEEETATQEVSVPESQVPAQPPSPVQPPPVIPTPPASTQLKEPEAPGATETVTETATETAQEITPVSVETYHETPTVTPEITPTETTPAESISASPPQAPVILAVPIQLVVKPVPPTPPVVLPIEETVDWKNADAVYQKGVSCLKSGQLDKAKAYFQRLLELSARNILGLLGLGQVFLKLGQGSNALEQFTQATAVDPNEGEAWLGKGNALLKLQQPEAALEEFDRALQLNSSLVNALKAKGDAFLALGRQGEANRCYDQANALQGTPIPVWKPTTPDAEETIEEQPAVPVQAIAPEEPTAPAIPAVIPIEYTVNWQSPIAVYYKGLTCLDSGQLNDAEPYFRRVLELSPNNALALIGLGQIYVKQGQLETALAYFNQALENEPTRPQAWIGKGDALMLLGRSEEGKQHYAYGQALSDIPLTFPPTDTPARPSPRPVKPDVLSEEIQAPITPPQLLDMVILVNTQGPLKAEVMAMGQVMDEAIETTTNARPADVRLTWLGTHEPWEETPVQQSASDYLNHLGISLENQGITDSQPSPAHIISTLTRYLDWRPGAAQSLFYMGHESLSPDNQADGLPTVQPVIQTAKDTGTTINTYLSTQKSPGNTAAAIAEYHQVATATGGLAFTDHQSNRSFYDVLTQTIDQSCRECIYRRLTIDSQSDCYVLDHAQMSRLQSLGNTTPLAPGSYIVRIKSGNFSYWTNAPDFDPEPWVILWIYGGRVINRKTNVEVGATWVTLNGYDDALKLEVLEGTNLCALFLDTYKDDNSGQVILSILEAN